MGFGQTSFYVARFDGADWTTYNMIDLLGHGVGSIAVTPDGVVWGDAGEHGIVRYDSTHSFVLLAVSPLSPTTKQHRGWVLSPPRRIAPRRSPSQLWLLRCLFQNRNTLWRSCDTLAILP
jgi:hypothetical protein